MDVMTFRDYCRYQNENPQERHRVDIGSSDEPQLDEMFGWVGKLRDRLFGQSNPPGSTIHKYSDDLEPPAVRRPPEEEEELPSVLPMGKREIRKERRERARAATGGQRLGASGGLSPEAQQFLSKYRAESKLSPDMWPREMMDHFLTLQPEDQYAINPKATPRGGHGNSTFARNRRAMDRRLSDRGMTDAGARGGFIKDAEDDARRSYQGTPEEQHARWQDRMTRKHLHGQADAAGQADFAKRRSRDKLAFIDRFVKTMASNFGGTGTGGDYSRIRPEFVNQALAARGWDPLTPEEAAMFGIPDGGRATGPKKGALPGKDVGGKGYEHLFGDYKADNAGVASREPAPPPPPRRKAWSDFYQPGT